MIDLKRIEEIQQRLTTNAYFVNPHSDANVQDDIRYLLKELEQQIKKNDVLANQVGELTQEIENVRSDFGRDR